MNKNATQNPEAQGQLKIVIIGRPNVGKSTLFNRLAGKRRALVLDIPGVTRDRIEIGARWVCHGQSIHVGLVDTGGLGGERFSDDIRRQVDIGISEADVVLAVFDGQMGLTPLDESVMKGLKKSGLLAKLPVIAVVNKIDDEKHEAMASEFFALGMEPLVTVSAEHGRGIEDLKQAIVELARERTAASVVRERAEVEIPKVAIVGKPNVGKSTLINALLGKERMITSPIPGTTVDAVDSLVYLESKPFIFVDTAGIRRKSKTEKGVEVLSVVQAKKTLERADVAILLLDGEQGTADQDEKIGGLIEEAGCGVILAVNKWDTQLKNRKFTKDMAAERIRSQMAYLKYAPIVFMSAKNRVGFQDIGDLIEEILKQREVNIPTHEFTEWVRAESTVHNPNNAKFYMCHQSGRHPPSFVCHVNDPRRVDFSLKRHLINAMRDRWGYMGNPVRLHFVAAKESRTRR